MFPVQSDGSRSIPDARFQGPPSVCQADFAGFAAVFNQHQTLTLGHDLKALVAKDFREVSRNQTQEFIVGEVRKCLALLTDAAVRAVDSQFFDVAVDDSPAMSACRAF